MIHSALRPNCQGPNISLKRPDITRAAFAAAALAAILAVSLGTAKAAVPAVRLADRSPLTLVGGGFGARERVVVRVLRADERPLVRRLTASAAGRFTAVFRATTLEECSAYKITAVGKSGTRAQLRHEIPPACGIITIP